MTFRLTGLKLRPMITKRQAIDLYGSVRDLQTALGLKTHSAISMWGEDDSPIPKVHELRLRHELKPEWFSATGRLLRRARRADP